MWDWDTQPGPVSTGLELFGSCSMLPRVFKKRVKMREIGRISKRQSMTFGILLVEGGSRDTCYLLPDF